MNLRCASPGCDARALDDSNHCGAHQPPPPVRERFPLPLLALPIIACLVLLAGWASDDVKAWLRSFDKPLPRTARIQCYRPSELETVVVFVNADANGVLRLECGHVGGAGAYVKESRR